MTAKDSTTLAALMAAYDKSVLFEEAVPSSYRLARLFAEMQWSSGGLVLLGVMEDGRVVGIDPGEIDDIYSRFEHLCGDLTQARVEIGTLHLGEKVVVFLVFNTLPRNVAPLQPYAGDIERIATF